MKTIDEYIELSRNAVNISDGGSPAYKFDENGVVLVQYSISNEYGEKAREMEEKVAKTINEKNEKGVNTPLHIAIKRTDDGKKNYCWVLQEIAKGQNYETYNSSHNDAATQIKLQKKLIDAPDFIYEKAIKDLCELFNMGLEPKSKNIFFDENNGFSFIDFLKENSAPLDNNSKKDLLYLKELVDSICLCPEIKSYSKENDEKKFQSRELCMAMKLKFFKAMEKEIPDFSKNRRWILRTYRKEELDFFEKSGIEIGDLTLTDKENQQFEESILNIVKDSYKKIESGEYKYWQIMANEIRVDLESNTLQAAWKYHKANQRNRDDFKDKYEYEGTMSMDLENYVYKLFNNYLISNNSINPNIIKAKEELPEDKEKTEIIDDQFVEGEFKKIINQIMNEKKESDYSFILQGLCGKDVSEIDMSNLSLENFKRLTFDEKTIFSKEQVEKFHPEALIEKGKKFSESMEKLHAEGIDGSGTTIGIIDQCFDSSIPEFEDRVVEHIVFDKNADGVVSPREYSDEDVDGFHGKTTASLAGGKECGVAPKAKLYLFGIAEGTDWKEEKAAIVKYIVDNNIKLDIISMSADVETSDETKERLDELEKEGCTLLDSSKFWRDFSWGRINDNGEVALDELMKTMSNMPYDEKSRGGKVLSNIPNSVLLPCTGRTSLQTGKEEVYKYNGSVCGASFAIPQVAGLFAIARQIDPSIQYNEFIEIVKNPERLNSEGMMYVNPEEIVKEIQEKTKEKQVDTQMLGRQTLKEQKDTDGKLAVEGEVERGIEEQEKTEKGN